MQKDLMENTAPHVSLTDKPRFKVSVIKTELKAKRMERPMRTSIRPSHST